MKKSLIITTIGGFVSRFEMDDVHIMQQLGFEVHYASNFENRIYEFDKKEYIDNGIRLHQVEIDKNPYNIVALNRSLKDIIRIIKEEKIELIHCHTPVGGVLGRLAGKKTGCKVIYTAHGFHFYTGAPVKNWLIYYPVEKVLAKYTDCLIAINQADFEMAKKMHVKDYARIPGVGIDLRKFTPREGYKRDDNCFRIVSVGELNRNKNHRVVIKAIKQLNDKNIQYYIYGKGKAKAELENMITENQLENQVHLCGYVNDTREVLKDADCFVFPSVREGLGMAALEAMACGVPLIVGDNRGTREYVNHGDNAFACDPDDTDSFAYYIKKIKDNPDLTEIMVEKGIKKVQWFSKERTNLIMNQVYREIGL
ncbi:MAG: glycosyltransferase family 4 protein [Agathobacter rectalis]